MTEHRVSTVDGQPTLIPTAKVTAGTAAGALSLLVVALLNRYVFDPALPAELAAAVTTIVSSLAAYWMPPGRREGVGD